MKESILFHPMIGYHKDLKLLEIKKPVLLWEFLKFLMDLIFGKKLRSKKWNLLVLIHATCHEPRIPIFVYLQMDNSTFHYVRNPYILLMVPRQVQHCCSIVC